LAGARYNGNKVQENVALMLLAEQVAEAQRENSDPIFAEKQYVFDCE
jgi:hypothetical protein